jgi:PAS domain S-box-containing protein
VKPQKHSDGDGIRDTGTYKRVFKKALDALMIIDGKKGNILSVNEAAVDMFGYAEKDLVGMHYSGLFPDSADVPGLNGTDGIVNYDGVFVQEFKLADGSVRKMDFTITMIPWGLHSAFFATFRDASARIRVEQEREDLIEELQSALEKIRTLRGLLPICAHCKKVRDDEGYWKQVEVYITEHSLAEFSHGICPDCLKTYYSDLMEKEGE